MWVVFLIEQMKKKLVGVTREHEALINFVETNKHICTEKEKQKVKEPWTSLLILIPLPWAPCTSPPHQSVYEEHSFFYLTKAKKSK